MADIKQAARWMLEGQRVRRTRLGPEISLKQEKGWWIRVCVNGEFRSGQDCAPFATDDLLAEDWEIANTNED